MKKLVLITAYAVNPYKGSEDGMGWNFIDQVSRDFRLVAVTRKNNRSAIEQFCLSHPKPHYKNIRWVFIDLPAWVLRWKGKGTKALPYYLLWQLFVAVSLFKHRRIFSLVHHLNFHNDWAPTFLWLLGKPLVRGPVGHHPEIPNAYIHYYGIKEWFKDRVKHYGKYWYGLLAPGNLITRRLAAHTLVMHEASARRYHVHPDRYTIVPSVATDDMLQEGVRMQDGIFRILSVGRFVPLKGFDLTIESFSYFVKTLPYEQAERCRLILVGTGPYKNAMRNMTVRLGVDHLVEWIPWTTRNELKKIYNNASVFCFPSHEGAGMVVAEALSAGLPVIALDNIGPGKFINEQCGTIVREKTRPATIQALAQAMIQLYNQPRVWRAKSARARKHYLTHFTWEVRRQQLRKLYQKALMPKVALVHMYNDYSGSPQVLKTLAEALKIKQYNLQLFTGRYQGGLLSGIKEVRYFNLPYTVGSNDVTKLLGQAWYQWRLFFKVLFARDLARTLVINTIWPAGAALAGWLRGRRVVYYLHEAVIRPAPLAWLLKKVAAFTGGEFVYVSEYLKENLPVRNGEGQVIYNTLLPEEREPVTYPVAANEFVVTMLCSLRGYKGVDQFVALAHRMPHIQFQLVLNASEKETDEWCQRQGLPSNIWVYPAQQDVRRFYHRSQMVLNLSLPERWVETFGMTILEGMSHGCVVIAPPAGGIQELFTDGKEGWFVDPHDAVALEERINRVYTDERLLIKMKACAKVRASHFRFANYTRHWDDLLSNQEEANIPVAF